MVYTQPSICPREWQKYTSMGLCHTNLIIINKKREFAKLSTLLFPLTTEENWKGIDKRLWNMKVTIIPTVIGAFGIVTKGLLKGLGDLEVDGRVETIKTTALLRTARILRSVLETWGDLLSINFSERQSANADVKNSQGVNINTTPTTTTTTNNNNNKTKTEFLQ